LPPSRFAADNAIVHGQHDSAATPAPRHDAKLPLGLEPLAHARLVGEARGRVRSRLYGRDQLTTLGFGLGFVAAAFALWGALPAEPMPAPYVLVLLVLAHAVMCRVEFELGAGLFLPTQLVLVPMLFLAPPALVPSLVALGFVGAALPDLLRGRLHAERVFVRLSFSWHAVGPAIVFGLLHPGPPSWGDWPVYALALAAQFAFDFASSLGREWGGVGIAPRVLVPVLARTYLVDSLLVPVGFLAALAAVEHPLAFLPVLSLGALLALFASDRRERIGETIELSDAVETASSVARVDQLTGLPNRRAWEERLEAIDTIREPVSVILIDLDGLKLANDTRGHSFGDRLLRTTASLVSECVGARGLVARLGGDELGVLLIADEERCAEELARLEREIDRHPGVDGFRLSASLGAAGVPPEPTLIDALERADARMYAKKRRSRLSRIALEGLDRASSQ
jgi:diguanylate cyclase (GGDEF)-like protein